MATEPNDTTPIHSAQRYQWYQKELWYWCYPFI